MSDIAIDTSDPKAARRYARVYLWIIAVALAAFAFAVYRDRSYPPIGALFIIGFLLLPFYFRWRKIARCLEDKRKAAMVACALSQKGADFGRACEILKERVTTMQESIVVMADPRTWGRRQKLVTFRDDDLEVVLCERNGLVGDLKTYLR